MSPTTHTPVRNYPATGQVPPAARIECPTLTQVPRSRDWQCKTFCPIFTQCQPKNKNLVPNCANSLPPASQMRVLLGNLPSGSKVQTQERGWSQRVSRPPVLCTHQVLVANLNEVFPVWPTMLEEEGSNPSCGRDASSCRCGSCCRRGRDRWGWG